MDFHGGLWYQPRPLVELGGAKGGRVIVQIFVRDNNVDQALKALKKKMQREGLIAAPKKPPART